MRTPCRCRVKPYALWGSTRHDGIFLAEKGKSVSPAGSIAVYRRADDELDCALLVAVV